MPLLSQSSARCGRSAAAPNSQVAMYDYSADASNYTAPQQTEQDRLADRLSDELMAYGRDYDSGRMDVYSPETIRRIERLLGLYLRTIASWRRAYDHRPTPQIPRIIALFQVGSDSLTEALAVSRAGHRGGPRNRYPQMYLQPPQQDSDQRSNRSHGSSNSAQGGQRSNAGSRRDDDQQSNASHRSSGTA